MIALEPRGPRGSRIRVSKKSMSGRVIRIRRRVVELNTTLVSVARASGWSVGTLNRLSSGKLSPFSRVFSDVEQTLGLSPWPEIRPRLRRKNVLVPRRQTA